MIHLSELEKLGSSDPIFDMERKLVKMSNT